MKVFKFGAVWCSGCLIMRPRWEKVEKDNAWLKTEYYDYDKDRQAVKKFGIEKGRLPVFVFLDKKGKEIDRAAGELSEKKILELIEKWRDK